MLSSEKQTIHSKPLMKFEIFAILDLKYNLDWEINLTHFTGEIYIPK